MQYLLHILHFGVKIKASGELKLNDCPVGSEIQLHVTTKRKYCSFCPSITDVRLHVTSVFLRGPAPPHMQLVLVHS